MNRMYTKTVITLLTLACSSIYGASIAITPLSTLDAQLTAELVKMTGIPAHWIGAVGIGWTVAGKNSVENKNLRLSAGDQSNLSRAYNRSYLDKAEGQRRSLGRSKEDIEAIIQENNFTPCENGKKYYGSGLAIMIDSNGYITSITQELRRSVAEIRKRMFRKILSPEQIRTLDLEHRYS